MGKLIDLTGKRFGFWMVLSRASNNKSGQVQWKCCCECGAEKLVTANSLRSGNSTSCGCNHAPDLTGEVFGRLSVISLNKTSIDKSRRRWNCLCSCGQKVIVSTYKLREKITTSCGCALLDKMKEAVEAGKRIEQDNQSQIRQSLLLLEEQARVLSYFNQEMERSLSLMAECRREDPSCGIGEINMLCLVDVDEG